MITICTLLIYCDRAFSEVKYVQKSLNNSLKEEMQNEISSLNKSKFYIMSGFWHCSFNKKKCRNTLLAFPVLNSHLLNPERKSMPEDMEV